MKKTIFALFAVLLMVVPVLAVSLVVEVKTPAGFDIGGTIDYDIDGNLGFISAGGGTNGAYDCSGKFVPRAAFFTDFALSPDSIMFFNIQNDTTFYFTATPINDNTAPTLSVTLSSCTLNVIPSERILATFNPTDNIGVNVCSTFISDDKSSWTMNNPWWLGPPWNSYKTNADNPIIPLEYTDSCWFKVVVEDESGNRAEEIIGCYARPIMTSPAVGDTFYLGLTHDFTWDPDLVPYDVEISYDGKSTWSSLGSPTTGSWSVNVGNTITDECYLKVEIDTGTVVAFPEYGPFVIVDTISPTVNLAALPSNISGNTSYDLTWSSSDNHQIASRALYADYGSGWVLLDSSTNNTGTYSWNTGSSTIAAVQIKAIIYDVSGNSKSDTEGPTRISFNPSFTSSTSATKQPGFSYKVTYANPSSDNITITFPSKPDWITVVGDSLHGTPTDTSTETVRVKMTSDVGFADSMDVTLAVRSGLVYPYLTSDDTITVEVEGYFCYEKQYTSQAEDDVGFFWTYGPSWVQSANDTIFGTAPSSSSEDSVTYIFRTWYGDIPGKIVLKVAPENSITFRANDTKTFGVYFDNGITVHVDRETSLQMAVYDIKGRILYFLNRDKVHPGIVTVRPKLFTGVYILRVRGSGRTLARKIRAVY